jgi:hypothetical protein
LALLLQVTQMLAQMLAQLCPVVFHVDGDGNAIIQTGNAKQSILEILLILFQAGRVWQARRIDHSHSALNYNQRRLINLTFTSY